MFRRTVLSLALAAAFSSAAYAQCDTRFQVVNGTDQPVREIYVSSLQTQNWGDDLLGANVLAPGQTFLVTPSAAGLYDVRVVMMNSQASELRQVDVCRISSVAVTPAGLRAQ
jgi:hypothetical protein